MLTNTIFYLVMKMNKLITQLLIQFIINQIIFRKHCHKKYAYFSYVNTDNKHTF